MVRRQVFGHRLALCLAGLMLLPAVARGDDSEFIATLGAAHVQWIRDVEFVCEFKTYLKTVASQDAAWELTPEQMEPYSAGFFAKTRDTSRMKQVPVQAPVVDPDDRRRVQHVPFDEVCNRLIQVRFEVPNAVHNATTLHVEKLDDFQAPRSFQPGDMSGHTLSPLGIIGRRNLDPFSFGLDQVQVHKELVEKLPDHSTVRLTLDSPPWTQTKWIEFDTAGSIPVVSKVTEESVNATTGDRIDMVTTGRQFVECPGGRVAKEILHTVSQNKASCTALLWISEDLGDRQPEPSDFIIEVPEQCRIKGLKQKLPPGTVRQININALGLGDLATGIQRPESNAAADQRNSQTRGKLLFMTNGILAILFLLYWFRRDRSPSETATADSTRGS